MKATITIVKKDREKLTVDSCVAKGRYAALVAREELELALSANGIDRDQVRLAQYDIDGNFTFAFTWNGDGWLCHKPA